LPTECRCSQTVPPFLNFQGTHAIIPVASRRPYWRLQPWPKPVTRSPDFAAGAIVQYRPMHIAAVPTTVPRCRQRCPKPHRVLARSASICRETAGGRRPAKSCRKLKDVYPSTPEALLKPNGRGDRSRYQRTTSASRTRPQLASNFSRIVTTYAAFSIVSLTNSVPGYHLRHWKPEAFRKKSTCS
jgi:hypothetical protein